jgi:NhaC family Na+:H+ antiporter
MQEVREAKMWEALFPIAFLVLLLGINVYFYGEDASYGANQIALILSAAVSVIFGLRMGYSWKTLENGIINSIKSAMQAILILLIIGALAGTWLISGIIPSLIYYGIQFMSPEFFLMSAVIISAIVALATGSSWSTIATIGVALLGIGQAFNIHIGLTAGAIISGAYFGDKMSPLSDTTNLAPAMAGTDLFTHIRHMVYTTVPSIILTILIFLFIGLFSTKVDQPAMTELMLETIDERFNVTPWLFLVPLAVGYIIYKKTPALPALLIGVLVGGFSALIFQPHIVKEIGKSQSFAGSSYKAVVTSIMTKVQVPVSITKEEMTEKIKGLKSEQTFDDWKEELKYLKSKSTDNLTNEAILHYETEHNLNKLLKAKGMEGMLNTIWLIITAMMFGGVMEATGSLKRITYAIIKHANSNGSLIASTVGTCTFFNITASDQFLAIVVPGRMYASTYEERGLAPENLSRALEDSGTVTSVLIPWNTCGAAQAGALGVATSVYAPFAFFNILSPIISVLYGYFNIKINYLKG